MTTSQFDDENLAPRTEEEWDILRKKVQKEMEEEYLKDREEAMELLEPRLELLQAFKEGKTIQAFFENEWRDLYMGTFPSNWLFPTNTYRVKDIYTDEERKEHDDKEGIQDDMLLIPKPKFKVGDRVEDKFRDEHYIYECSYNLTKNIWSYLTHLCDTFYESELKLIERKEE